MSKRRKEKERTSSTRRSGELGRNGRPGEGEGRRRRRRCKACEKRSRIEAAGEEGVSREHDDEGGEEEGTRCRCSSLLTRGQRRSRWHRLSQSKGQYATGRGTEGRRTLRSRCGLHERNAAYDEEGEDEHRREMRSWEGDLRSGGSRGECVRRKQQESVGGLRNVCGQSGRDGKRCTGRSVDGEAALQYAQQRRGAEMRNSAMTSSRTTKSEEQTGGRCRGQRRKF